MRIDCIAATLLALVTFLSAAHAQTLTRPPVLTAFVEAENAPPGKATVLLGISIDATGAVQTVEVVESGGADFDAAAVAAARRFVFTPAEIDGTPAPVAIQYRYTFTETIIEPPQPTTVTLRGRVVDPNGAPVEGARVVAGKRRVTTTPDGGFALSDMPPGLYVVQVTKEGWITIRATEDARTPGADIIARYTLSPQSEDVDEELVIRAPRQIQAQSRVAIRADEARSVAGTQGDTLKVVQSLPGVGRAAAGSAALVVWGAAPEDTRVLVDGVEIPALYHLGGVRSTLHSGLVESIELVPGAFGPAYGRGIGGIVKVQTRRLSTDGVGGSVSVDPYDAAGMLTTQLGDDARMGIAARIGYLDRVFGQFVDNAAVFPIPRYADAQLKFEQDLRADEWIGLTVLASSDALDRVVAEQRDIQARRSLALIMPYRRITPAGASFAVTPHVVLGTRSLESRFGSTPARQQVDTLRAGLRADYRAALRDNLILAVGVDGLVEQAAISRIGSLNRPPREGDIAVFGQPPGDDVTADTLNTVIADAAVHARTEWSIGRWTWVPGLRLDLFGMQSDRLDAPIGDAPRLGLFRIEPALAPRLAARWRWTDALTLHAATGQYHQPPAPETLSPVFGNPRLSLSEAVHVVGGLQWRPADGIDVELTGFHERFDALVARNPASTPPLGEALTNDGTGQSNGVQLLVRRSTGALTGWLSYTLSRSTRVDAPIRPERLFDFDQTHVLSLVLGYTWKGLTLGARARYATGMPRTPVTGAVYDARSDRFQPLFGRQNSERLPAFMQLDLRAEYAFALPVGDLTVYLDVLNATDRANVEERAFTFDFSEERPVPGLPILALTGARWVF